MMMDCKNSEILPTSGAAGDTEDTEALTLLGELKSASQSHPTKGLDEQFIQSEFASKLVDSQQWALAVRLWTCETPKLYPLVNTALGLRSQTVMARWENFVKYLHLAISILPGATCQSGNRTESAGQSQPKAMVYRAIAKDQLEAMSIVHQVGATVAWLPFTSTTTSADVATRLAGDGGGLCVITAPAGTGAQLHTLSMYPIESEILLPANSCFEVTDITTHEGASKAFHLTYLGVATKLTKLTSWIRPVTAVLGLNRLSGSTTKAPGEPSGADDSYEDEFEEDYDDEFEDDNENLEQRLEVLTVTVVSCSNLGDANGSTKADPYVTVKLKQSDGSSKTLKTKPVKADLCPQYNELFEFDTNASERTASSEAKLVLEVWDNNTMHELGKYSMPLTELMPTENQSFKLVGDQGNECGVIVISILRETLEEKQTRKQKLREALLVISVVAEGSGGELPLVPVMLGGSPFVRSNPRLTGNPTAVPLEGTCDPSNDVKLQQTFELALGGKWIRHPASPSEICLKSGEQAFVKIIARNVQRYLDVSVTDTTGTALPDAHVFVGSYEVPLVHSAVHFGLAPFVYCFVMLTLNNS